MKETRQAKENQNEKNEKEKKMKEERNKQAIFVSRDRTISFWCSTNLYKKYDL